MNKAKPSEHLVGDIFGGLAAMLVALPSAIAFGIIIFSPLGPQFAGTAAVAGILGTIALGLVAPVFGGTARLVTAPCAPAAAVLSVFVAEQLKNPSIPAESIPLYVIWVGFLAGVFQLLAGIAGGGKFIKYIPYPVVAGYLSGVGVLIFLSQAPKMLGLPEGITVLGALAHAELINARSVTVGLVTIAAMVLAPKLSQTIPAPILAIASGIGSYFALSAWYPELRSLEGNSLVIGPVSASVQEFLATLGGNWSRGGQIQLSTVLHMQVPTLTLAVLLSIDTLKTCVVLDALTQSRHNSNRELVGQGLGNAASALLGGVPGAGTMGATLVNLSSGGKTRLSGVLVGAFAALAFILFGTYIAWIPIAALAGVLIVIAVRMIDSKSVSLLKHRSTIFDFLVILAVVISAVSFSLIVAAGVGTTLAVILFLREQMRSPVVRRKHLGSHAFSKKRRTPTAQAILETEGRQTAIFELQGQLFFGTTDRLYTELEPYLTQCTYVILDMNRVQSLDYTAANMLKQIHARIRSRHGHLILSSVPLSLPTGQNVREYLERLGFSESGMNLKFLDNLNAAMEWAEDEILAKSLHESVVEDRILDLAEFEMFSSAKGEAIRELRRCLTEQTYREGESIFKQGEDSDQLFFIRKGAVKILLLLSSGNMHHVSTFIRGDFFGDMAFLDRETRSANAVAVSETHLYLLSRSGFEQVAATQPELCGILFERLAHALAHRLRLTNIELSVLQES
jgi:SulP family sulfate permease